MFLFRPFPELALLFSEQKKSTASLGKGELPAKDLGHSGMLCWLAQSCFLHLICCPLPWRRSAGVSVDCSYSLSFGGLRILTVWSSPRTAQNSCSKLKGLEPRLAVCVTSLKPQDPSNMFFVLLSMDLGVRKACRRL